MRKILYLSLILVILIGCSEAKKNSSNDVLEKSTAIVLTRDTAVRLDPFIYSAKLTTIQKGSTFKIVKKSAKKSRIGKTQKFWYKLQIDKSMSGWVYAANLKIIGSDKKKTITNFVNDFWEKETDVMKVSLKGKWWSINKFGDFTSHCIEFNEDGTYLSYWKGSKNYIKGIYNFDFNKNQLIFLKGATFGKKMNFIKRGQEFTLIHQEKDGETRFKRILQQTTQDLNKKRTPIKKGKKK